MDVKQAGNVKEARSVHAVEVVAGQDGKRNPKWQQEVHACKLPSWERIASCSENQKKKTFDGKLKHEIRLFEMFFAQFYYFVTILRINLQKPFESDFRLARLVEV